MKIHVTPQTDNTETKQVKTVYAIDPPMKHYVLVKQRFPGAFL